jgi:aspartate aminotransferase-like enzyme
MCPVGRGKASRAEKAFKVIPGLSCICASNWYFVSMEKKTHSTQEISIQASMKFWPEIYRG